VLLIDGSARASLGEQLSDIANFAKEIPSNAKFAVAYMQAGTPCWQARCRGPGTGAARASLAERLGGRERQPLFLSFGSVEALAVAGSRGARAVVMITDGVDEYSQRFDPDDPYVQAAITDSVRAGVVVYSMYWHDQGRASSSGYETGAGQNLMAEVTQATAATATGREMPTLFLSSRTLRIYAAGCAISMRSASPLRCRARRRWRP